MFEGYCMCAITLNHYSLELLKELRISHTVVAVLNLCQPQTEADV